MIKIAKRGIALLVVLAGFFLVFDYIYANTKIEQPGEVETAIVGEFPESLPVETPEPALIKKPEEPVAKPLNMSGNEKPEEPQFSQLVDDEQLDSILLLVNKSYQLPSDYIPADLTEVKIRFSPSAVQSKRMMRKEAAEALEELFREAEIQNIMLFGVSGYRSYETQRGLYDRKVSTAGQAMADKYVAYPGKSEHQTGLAMDVTNQKGINKSLTEDFGKTPEGIWLEENAHLYGFIIRYPFGKESITGYSYEPWHLRYVGENAAMLIKVNQLVFEEYVNPSYINLKDQ